jgi:zinc D-Ala-D-Ala carboxypeptidase
MEKISDNISFLDATKSQTAIRSGIDNKPDAVQLKNMQSVAKNIFEPLKRVFPLCWVSSFFRCLLLNKLIGGAKNSQHVAGEAIDIDSNGFNAQIFFFIKNNLEFDQLIWEFGTPTEPDWVHASYKESGNRKEILRAVKIGGKTVYKKFDL